MATNDVLIELKEDLNRDRVEQFFKKHGKRIGTLLAIFVITLAAYEVWKAYDQKQRIKDGDQLYAVISNFNELKDASKLQELQKNHAYKDIATLVEANFHETKMDMDAMQASYEKIAKDHSANPALRELAQINLASIKLNNNPKDADAEKTLQDLSAEGKIFRYTAMEMLGGYYRKNGKNDEARKVYEKLSNDTNAPASLAGRAKSMLSSF